MKRQNIYKQIALSLLLLVGMAGNSLVWGQTDPPQYVTGDKYKLVPPPTTFGNFQVYPQYTDSDNNNTGQESNDDERSGENYTVIMDGDISEDNWYAFDKNGYGENRNVVIEIKFNDAPETIGSIWMKQGSQKYERVAKVKVEYKASAADEYTEEGEYNLSDPPQIVNIKLNKAITASSVKLTLTRVDDEISSGNTGICLHEIAFLPEIQHKSAMWHSERNGLTNTSTGDTFDENTKMFHSEMMEGTTEIQASHTYIDTIYVHKGSKTRLTLPTIQSSEALSSVAAYQRWYSYRTDGTFETNHKDDVYDLLTPVPSYATQTTSNGQQTISPTAYRFANGYVGNPEADANDAFLYTNSLVEMDFYYPTDDEFGDWFPNAKDSKFDNNWYIVACDVSCYTDYKDWKKEQIGTYCEPTLSHRVLFYIVGVDDRENETGTNFANWYAKLKETDYQGATSTDYESKKFLEEYDITFPYTRVSTNTLDMVALTKDARGYAIPDAENDTEELTLTLVDGSGTEASGITFANETETKSSTISGENRVIHFKYPTTLSDGSQRVSNKNAKATILVTKEVGGTTYNLVRYNLTFVPETQLLTETQIEKIETGGEDVEDKYWYMPERTPKYLQDHYTLVTSMTWDYKEAKEKQEGYYPFPMDWSYSSYAFYDGSKKNTEGHYFYGQHAYPQWGYYAIMKGYVSWDTPTLTSEDEHHLYVDASDRPGTIARLPFRRSLCAGSELLVSAIVKSANPSKKNDDAGMLFTIFRVKEDKNGNTISSTPIYRHATGQIMHTNLLSDNVPHDGNEWYQVYFSFTNGDFGNEDLNPDDDIQYSYVLQIDNYSASTDGGDMYLDNVQVFVRPMTAEVTQMEATCDKRTRMNIRLNWEQLLSHTQGFRNNDDTKEDMAMDFCFIDKEKYEAAIGNNTNEAAAIKAAAVQIGDDDSYNKPFGTLYYRWNFEDKSNKDYTIIQTTETDGALAKNNESDGKYYFYTYTDDNDEKYLSVDFYSDLAPFKEYVILLRDHQNEDEVLTDENFASNFINFSDPCAMKDTFTVQGQNVIQMNGQVIDDSEDLDDYCTGQIFDFSVKLQIEKKDENGNTVKDEEGKIVYENYDASKYGTVYFDWFFGTMDDFDPETGESLYDALKAFRAEYPDATDLENVTATGNLTDTQIALLKSYVEGNPDEGGIQHPLVLYQETLPIRILDEGLDLVVCPIDNLQSQTGDETTSDEEAYKGLFCWSPIELHLDAKGESPTLQVGFEDVTYPYNDEYNPGVRIGLDQIEAAQVSTDNSETNPTIKINLRDAKFVSSDSSADHLGILGNTDNIPYAMTDLHLVNTNDPNYTELVHHDDFDMHAYSIGKIVSLYAKPQQTDETNTKENILEVRFNLQEQEDQRVDNNKKFQFNPREGYYYTFGFHFEEKQTSGDAIEAAEGCYGSTVITMHVVPEYQKWIGGATDNWNNDENWARSSSTELKKAENSYTDYDDDDKLDGRMPGYVPMKFTKVTIPGSKIELYDAGDNSTASGTIHKILALATNGETNVTGSAKMNIEYDMLVNPDLNQEANAYICEPYYTNKVDQIHFEPKAEMLHAELLQYEKAWVDYKLESGKWHTLASPLQGVVAGDFYTDSETGTEEQEYFSDIKFSNTETNKPNGADKANNRIKPSVYQRGWKGDTYMVSTGTSKNDVAVSGNWSAVYNDVEEAYNPGTGFSLKVLNMPSVEGKEVDEAIFRLPKADDSYSYYNSNGEASGTSTTITRGSGNTPFKAGQLEISDLDDDTKEITVPLKANGNSNYYLIGNPFMAHLDAAKFFAENSSVLEQKYWTVTEDIQNVAASKDDDWISTLDGVTIPPLRSFFVKKAGNATDSEVSVKFTKDMQVLGETSNEGTNTNALILTAKTADGKMSRAAIAYDMSADKDYAADEDAELFLDSNLSDVPAIYTVAGTMATSINRTSELYNIPVGIYGHSTEMVTLSFEGLKHFSSATLYDAEKKTETPLREGTTLTVPASTSGRYFLRAGTPTGNEILEADEIQIYTLSGNRVMVTSSTPLKDIRVYNLGGALTKHVKAGVCSFELYLPDGIYIVTAENANGEVETEKVSVR